MPLDEFYFNHNFDYLEKLVKDSKNNIQIELIQRKSIPKGVAQY